MLRAALITIAVVLTVVVVRLVLLAVAPQAWPF
jgi:hypothetical protein